MSTRHEKKHDSILNAATLIFMKNGFANTSMDAIAEAAPVSKATLYKHFVDKKDLFRAAIRFRCDALLETVDMSIKDSDDVEDMLTQIAKAFIGMVYSPDALSVLRILCAESSQFPDLSKMYFDDGPKVALISLSKYLDKINNKNHIRIPDSIMAANIFMSMMKGELFTQCLLGIKTEITPTESNNIINEAVSLFMKGYSHAQ